MPKGKRATPKQSAAGRHNCQKAQLSRKGTHGNHYQTKRRKLLGG